jgi:hypothetical protein
MRPSSRGHQVTVAPSDETVPLSGVAAIALSGSPTTLAGNTMASATAASRERRFPPNIAPPTWRAGLDVRSGLHELSQFGEADRNASARRFDVELGPEFDVGDIGVRTLL